MSPTEQPLNKQDRRPPGTSRLHNVSLRQLSLLVALGDEGKMHVAASKLFMTQPAASRLIMEVEQALEAKLFERHARGMTPTLYGETVIRHAREMLDILANARDELEVLRKGFSGQVEVGVIMTPGMSLMPSVIARTKEKSPRVRITVHMDTSKVLLSKLQGGELDFMIGRMDENDDQEGLCYEDLGLEPVCAVVRLGHFLLKQEHLQLTDLATLPWILPPVDSALHQRWDLMFRRVGLEPPTNTVHTTSVLVTTALLLQTESVHVLPVEIARYYASLNMLAILPIDLPCHMDAFGIISRQARRLSPCAQRFLDDVRLAARDLY